MWSLEVPGHLKVLGWKWGAVCGLKIVQMLPSLRKGGWVKSTKSTIGRRSHQTPSSLPFFHPPNPPLHESCHFYCLQGVLCPKTLCVTLSIQALPLLPAPELTRNRASCRRPSALMSSPAESRHLNLAKCLGVHPLLGLFSPSLLPRTSLPTLQGKSGPCSAW